MELWIASSRWEAIAITMALANMPGSARARRVMLAVSHTTIPEVDHWWLDDPPSMANELFDSVLDYNQIIAPYHPGYYRPNPRDRYDLAGRIIALAGRPGVSLVGTCNLESVPSAVIADLFPTAPIALVHAHGTDWNAGHPPYSAQMAQRVLFRHHLDLVSGTLPCFRGLKTDSFLVSAAPADIKACWGSIDDEATRRLAIGLLGEGKRSPSTELSIAQLSKRSQPVEVLTREQLVERAMRRLWMRLRQWVR